MSPKLSKEQNAAIRRGGGIRKITLRPNRSVITVSRTSVIEISAEQVSSETVGQKAAGLLTLPKNWTLPFFVVLDEALIETSSSDHLGVLLQEAALRAGVTSGRVMVRSNGVEEGLAQRGALASLSCPRGEVPKTLRNLRAQALGVTQSRTHWLVQDEVKVQARGQLSNERRVRHEKRDWAIEIEASSGRGTEQTSIAVRRWRDGQAVSEAPLTCDSTLKTSLALRRVANWAVQDSRRFLFEWVWDGATIHLVQMDVATTKGGERPKDLLPATVSQPAETSLQFFKGASAHHKERLRKLGNARLYEALGYSMPPFYVLDDRQEITTLLHSGRFSSGLISDLEQLTSRPLILRTDGANLPREKREMLPRSEELRTAEAAVDWLTNKFRPTIQKLGLAESDVVLIGHHFIPSVASAWAGAEPGKRWVRIEALWGIPESLYWHSHDTFEVDVEKADLSIFFTPSSEYPIRARTRFKGIFIAPDPNGAWIHHQTKAPFDWAPTIKSKEWLFEIAHTTRRICEHLGKPVEVMWFVDTHPDATNHRVLPWYHSVPENTAVPVRAPRKKIRMSQERFVRDQKDWTDLQEAVKVGLRIERVVVEPNDPNLVRNLDFAEELGALAREHQIVVVLAGGILSHAYHALRRTGASVECIDLFGATEEKAEYNKLVRDNVPAQIADRGEHFEIVRLEGDALIDALRRKLVEEALEALDANAGTDLVGELADLQEVVKAIAKAIQVSPQDLEDERQRKRKKRGGFEQGYLLLTTASPHSIAPQVSSESLISITDSQKVRTIGDPSNVPRKAVYKRPDRRTLPDGTEEMLVVETELNRLGALQESINFQLPPSFDAQQYTLSIELSRSGGELRVTMRLQLRQKKGQSEGQIAFDFGAT
jgi:predicted house-cleaning noncanonical NTP pyrophosphatase (MazG superfamily)